MFLEALIRTSLQGAIAILVLYGALRAFPAASPKLRLWLWRLVFLKLVLGLIPFAPIMLRVLPTPSAAHVLSSAEVPAEAAATPSTEVTSQVQPAIGDTPPQEHPVRVQVDPWLAIYLAGVAVFGGLAIFRAYRFRSVLRNAGPITDSVLLSNLWTLSQAAGRTISPMLLESNEVATALVVGWKNPAIVLPREKQPREDLALILAHEVAHLGHRDLEWNCFTSAMQALFFFHPAVWLAASSYRRAQESAADQAAIRLSKTSPRRYAEMLVRATVVSSPSLLSAPAGMSVAGSTASMQQRLRDMRNFNTKPTLAKLAFAVVLSVASLAMVPAYSLGRVDPAGIQDGPGGTLSLASKPETPGKLALTKTYTTVAKKAAKLKPAKSPHAPHKASSAPPKAKTLKAPPSGRPAQVHDLTFDAVKARDGFRKLFEAYGKSFSITPDVTGSITLFARNVTFEQALQNMTNQVHAACRLENGIYQITKRPLLAFARLAPVDNRMSFGGRGLFQRSEQINQTVIPSLEFMQSDVRAALREVFRTVNASYSIEPEVQGTVTISLRNVSFETALANILRQVDATYRFDNGMYRVYGRSKSGGAAGGVGGPFRPGRNGGFGGGAAGGVGGPLRPGGSGGFGGGGASGSSSGGGSSAGKGAGGGVGGPAGGK